MISLAQVVLIGKARELSETVAAMGALSWEHTDQGTRYVAASRTFKVTKLAPNLMMIKRLEVAIKMAPDICSVGSSKKT